MIALPKPEYSPTRSWWWREGKVEDLQASCHSALLEAHRGSFVRNTFFHPPRV